MLLTADNRWRPHYLFNPKKAPLLAPAKWAANTLRRWLGRPRGGPLNRFYSIRQVDTFLAAAGLEKIRSITLGLGPFSFLDFKLTPDSLAIKLHQKLQGLADRGLPFIRSTGGHYLVLARKPG